MALILYLMRHGESTGNLTRQLQSQLDTELTERGHEQAIQIKGQFDVSIVYHSPLQRASKTAMLIFPHGVELVQLEDLIEEDIGILTGKLYPMLTDEELHLLEQVETDPDFTGHEGESRNQLKKRAIRAMEYIVENMERRSIKKAMVISHGGLLGSFLKRYLGFENISLVNCKPVIIKFDIDNQKWDLSNH